MSIYFTHHKGETKLSKDEMEGLYSTHVLTIHDLDILEQRNIEHGFNWLKKHEQENPLTVEFVLHLHKHLFGEVWKWAGLYRRSEKNIGINPNLVPIELYKLLQNTNFWIENKTYSWNEIMARFHHRFVQIHPFPNGNGRIARILVEHLCRKYKYSIPHWRSDIQDGDQRRSVYLEALREADQHHYSKLIEFLSHHK